MLIWLERAEDVLFVKSRNLDRPWGPVRYPAALLRDWLRGDINMRAMSLVYTTLLSLVPLMAFSFSILKGLGARDDLELLVYEFFRPMGDGAPALTARVMEFVQNTRGGVLGSIGLVFLVWTVVTTIQKVEESFNFVWRVERPRNFARRLSEYLSVMIVAPVLLGVTISFFTSAADSSVAHSLAGVAPVSAVLGALNHLLPYFVVTVVFTFMYMFVPNTRVKFLAALVGGIAAGVLWAVVGKVFTAFILYSSRMMAIYTGFAIVLTTLIWVYLNWLILLIGAQLAFYLQHPQYLRHGQALIELAGGQRERVGMSVMYLIARDYATGKAYWTTNRLAHELDVPSAALAPVLGCLERSGLIVATENEQLVPARDIAGIELIDVLNSVRGTLPGRTAVAARAAAAAETLILKIEKAMRQSVAGKTLKDLLD
jgi:membrane protein